MSTSASNPSPAQEAQQRNRGPGGQYALKNLIEPEVASLDRTRVRLEQLRQAADRVGRDQAAAFLSLSVQVAANEPEAERILFTKSPTTGTLTCVTPVFANGSYGTMFSLERLCDGYSDQSPPAFTFDTFMSQFDPDTVTLEGGARGTHECSIRVSDLFANHI